MRQSHVFMRPCTPASLCLAAMAAVLPAAAPAHARPPAHAQAPVRAQVPAHAPAPAQEEAPLPACASAGDRAFPLTARLRGGPAAYPAGGGFGTWYLELANTTDRPCAGVHPVVVLVDEERALKPSQFRLEFHDGERFRPVRFETTDRDEFVGAFADEEAGFPGFTVGPGGTLTVKVRLAVAPDAVPGEVTANAAVVQRHEDDGDWVGQSNDYRFRIDAGPVPGSDTGSASPVPGEGTGFPFVDELARTGSGGRLLAAAVAALLTGGTAALLLTRRRR
ncbi:hypothetical protein CP969_15295 [Streptomyces viridosporus T7A]|uniref:Gram-positive cocci surface proteins LPxTG domain-containing protein n=2 Tax=Streptomyces viridosporus TaxID=67581 RepID=A0ABX6AEK4_STRVD|nr:hypothetical protein CP969_15295 [Streptomyces viridosporus T7A]